MTKNFVENDKDVETQFIPSKFTDESGTVTSGQHSICGLVVVILVGKPTTLINNYPENAILYINQAYLTIESNKKIYYADFQIIGQITEALNPPEDVANYYICKERKVQFGRPRYNPTTGEFLGLYETISFLIVRGNEDEYFLNYGFDENKSKLLYYFYKRRIPNFFWGGTLFTRSRIMFESGELSTDFSKVNYFLPPITDRSEEFNRYMNCVNIHPFDIGEKEFGNDFKPNRLDFIGDKKAETVQNVCNVLKKVAQIFNTNLIKNVDGLLNKKQIDTEVEWVRKYKVRQPQNKFKVSY